MPDTTLLITGAAGFLGSHLCERALTAGCRVIGLDNFYTGRRRNIDILEKLGGENFCFAAHDVTTDWAPALARVPTGWMNDLRLVFHFASPASPPHYQRLGLETMWVNSIGLSRALEAADRNRARVIFSSTSEIYGDPQIPIQSEEYRGWVNTVGPRSCYDESKRFGESLVYTHNLKHGTRHGIVRIFNTYGPRMNPDDGRVIINFLVQALAGQALTVYGTGRQSRSFCYVEDLIEGIWRFAHQETDIGPMNLGNDRVFTILELAQAVQTLFADRNLELRHLPALPDDPRQRNPDLARAKKALGWSPLIPLEDGLRRMTRWLEAELPIGAK